MDADRDRHGGRFVRLRRRRATVIGAVAVVLVLSAAGVWSVFGKAPGLTVRGSGPTACRSVVHQTHVGRLVDSRVVDGATLAVVSPLAH